MNDVVRLRTAIWAAATVLAWALALVGHAHAGAEASPAEAASAKYSIAVFVSQPGHRCYERGAIKAIEYFARERVRELNRLPEFSGRQVRVDIYDDYGDAKASVENVRKALADPLTVAMVGLFSSSRGKAVFDTLGDDIGKSGIPFITDLSVTKLFEPYANVFTMRPSQENERVPVLAQFFKDGKYARPAFLGMLDVVASSELAKLLRDLDPAAPLVAEVQVPVEDFVPDKEKLKAALAGIAAKEPDIIFLMLGWRGAEMFLQMANEVGLRTEVFLLTDNERALKSEPARNYGPSLYQFAWQTLPDQHNSRLRRDMLADPSRRWLFPDVVLNNAKGWSDGTCKPPDDGIVKTPLDQANIRALSRGSRHGDIVAMIGDILKFSPPESSVSQLRQRILTGVTTTYAAGRGTFRGSFDNWSFHPLRRTATQTPLILKKSRGAQNPRLAPRQYVKLRNETLREIRTLYMDVDLTRIFRVNDDEKSFFAEFFLTTNADSGVPMEAIDFANAFFDAEDGGQKITIQALNEEGASGVYPSDVRIYKITGKFMMRPDFARYPFDTQLFPIELKPKNGDAAFIVQPPPGSLRDRVQETDGWLLRDQYVGYDEDYIPITDARTDEKSIVPFYKAEFAYVMQREATDYYLRVVIPLAFILIVAFLSIFIPNTHFEAIVTIQVTALLSAVALYLSIPKVGNDAATVSDRIFLIDYLAVSVMIAICIARVNPRIQKIPGLERMLKGLHIVGTPLLIAAMAYYLADMRWAQVGQAFYGEEETAVSAPPQAGAPSPN